MLKYLKEVYWNSHQTESTRKPTRNDEYPAETYTATGKMTGCTKNKSKQRQM